MQTKRFKQHLAPTPSSLNFTALFLASLPSSPTTPEAQGDGAMGSVHNSSSLLLLHPTLFPFIHGLHSHSLAPLDTLSTH